MSPRRRRVSFTAPALLALCVVCAAYGSPRTLAAVSRSAHASLYEYRGGRWFTGKGFVAQTVYVSQGRFVEKPAAVPDSVVDLHGAFVIPPFAEGHNHWLEPRAVDAYIQSYLRDGVFYLMEQASAPRLRSQIAPALNRPTSVDFISANQGWTGPGGHPLQIGLQFVAMGTLPAAWKEADLDGPLAMVVRDSVDIASRWPVFLADKPDFVKLFLLYSEEYERRSADTAYRFRRGLDPRLASEIVRRAHAAGLRASAHVYTAADFRTAVAAGVDIVAHFPGTGYDAALGPAAFRITDADARLAAQRHVVVMTTLYWLGNQGDSAQNAILLREVIRPNWALLRKHGVPILIGSDEFRATPVHEATVLVHTGLMTPLEAVQALSVLTPKEIFPTRKIGELRPGFEASFLALSRNPLENFANVGSVTLRVKQGVVLQLTSPAPAYPKLGP